MRLTRERSARTSSSRRSSPPFLLIAILALVLPLFVGGQGRCAASAPQGPSPSDPFALRVSLFPWIPRSDAFARWIEEDFERAHPTIDLVVRPMDRADVTDLSYDLPFTIASLLTEAHDDSFHVIEVDAMLLGDLVRARAIQPFAVARTDFLPFAAEAATVDGAAYGVPHWTCGYFVISPHQAVARASSATDLVSALSGLSTGKISLAGDIEGSWDSIMVYVDAYLDSYPTKSPSEAVKSEGLDQRVRDGLGEVARQCTHQGRQYCKDAYLGAELLATGDADALIGYSERLNSIIGKNPALAPKLFIASAPLGNGSRPTLFTDALVLSRNCTDACSQAATAFAAYYVSDRVFEVALMSLEDKTGATPRYLLPSTEGAFDTPSVAQDPLYRQLRQAIAGASPYPSEGIPSARQNGYFRARVNAAMGVCPKADC